MLLGPLMDLSPHSVTLTTLPSPAGCFYRRLWHLRPVSGSPFSISIIGTWLKCVALRDAVALSYDAGVAYSMSLVPPSGRLIYCLNPMTGVIDAWRFLLFGGRVNFSLGGVCDLVWNHGASFMAGLSGFSDRMNRQQW